MNVAPARHLPARHAGVIASARPSSIDPTRRIPRVERRRRCAHALARGAFNGVLAKASRCGSRAALWLSHGAFQACPGTASVAPRRLAISIEPPRSALDLDVPRLFRDLLDRGADPEEVPEQLQV